MFGLWSGLGHLRERLDWSGLDSWSLQDRWGTNWYYGLIIVSAVGLLFLFFNIGTAKYLKVIPVPKLDSTIPGPDGFLVYGLENVTASDGKIIVESHTRRRGTFTIMELTVAEDCVVIFRDLNNHFKQVVDIYRPGRHFYLLEGGADVWIENYHLDPESNLYKGEIHGIFSEPDASMLVSLRNKELGAINFSAFLVALGIIPIFMAVRRSRSLERDRSK